jgi:hypothetical protein
MIEPGTNAPDFELANEDGALAVAGVPAGHVGWVCGEGPAASADQA